jgi:putative PIN family toxin of toxin-antitoxin system
MELKNIVIDTNVTFSALNSRSGASFKLISIIPEERFCFHLSVPLVLEYEEKLKEKRKHLGMTDQDIDDFVDYLCAVGVCHNQVNIFWRPCLNDPDDEMILELSIHAKADFIVTHNIRDFNRIKGFRIRAVKPGEFLSLLKKENLL